MTPEDAIRVLREVEADAKASEGDYYADQFAWHGAGEIADAVEQMAAEIARLREERRWVPVGERLPEGEEWVDVAGLWGDSVGWHEPSGWHDIEDDHLFLDDVTHWRKRGPGPEANG